MKSIVTDKKNETKPFPKLMIGNKSGIIVLMIDEITGAVVGEPNGKFILGHYSDNWNDIRFTDYTGTVTLSND